MFFKKNLLLQPLYILKELYSTEQIMAIKQENLDVVNNSWKCCCTLLQNKDHSVFYFFLRFIL